MITGEEYNFWKQVYTKNLNALNKKISEVEYDMQKAGINKEEIQFEKYPGHEIKVEKEKEIKVEKEKEIKVEKEKKQKIEKEILEIKQIPVSKKLERREAELQKKLKQKQDIIPGLQEELKKYENKIKDKTDELQELNKKIEDLDKVVEKKAELALEKQKILDELKKLHAEFNDFGY